jgi:hypothetical protein
MTEVKGISLRSAGINERVPEDERAYFGYVYVDETRVGFDESNGMWATRPVGYWPEPSFKQAQEAYRALQYEPWGNKIPNRYYDSIIERESEVADD